MATEFPIDRAAAAVEAWFSTLELEPLDEDRYRMIALGAILALRHVDEEQIAEGARDIDPALSAARQAHNVWQRMLAWAVNNPDRRG